MTLVALLGVSVVFMSCSKEDNVKKGKLSGSSWVYKDSYSSSVSSYDYTYTFKFTSDKSGVATRKGWIQVINAATWTLKPKEDVDQSQNFTYEYFPEFQHGFITFASKGIYTVGTHEFFISDDFKEIRWGSTVYKLQ